MPDRVIDDDLGTRTSHFSEAEKYFLSTGTTTMRRKSTMKRRKSKSDPKLLIDTGDDHSISEIPTNVSDRHTDAGVEGEATVISDLSKLSLRDSWMEDSVESEEIQRPRLEFKNCYNLLFVIFIFLEPLSSVAGFLNNQGRLLFPLLIPWLRVCAGISEQQVPSRYKWRVKANSLINGRFLGQGCSGIFYETTWSGLRDSTVKLARKLFPGVKGDIFEIEVVRLFELNDHPNIVKTFCWTVDNRSCSLVMQYVRDNLSGVLRKRKEALRKESASKQLVIGTGPIPFQLPEALEILKQIAFGIRHLHDQGITHGDLKPNNVLVDYEDGQILVKLADFGLVETKKRTNLISQRTRCTQIIKWSAPELHEDYFGFMGEDVEFLCKKSLKGSDMTLTSSASKFENRAEVMMTKADSYSFALTSAFILGGKMWNPNQSENEQLMSAISNGLRPKLPPQCPQSLESLIALCWDAEPLRRPSFSEICQKLEEISLV